MSSISVLEDFFCQHPSRLYRKNTIIFDAGQTPQGLFFLISGRVKLATTDSRGQESILVSIGPGDVFPLAPYFMESALSTTYTAMTDVEAIWRPLNEVSDFLNRNPQAMRDIMKIVLRDFYSRVTDLSVSNSKQRVLSRLTYLASRFGEPAKNGTRHGVEMTITQQELADSINLTRESISIILNRLQDQGVVQLRRSKIFLDVVRAQRQLKDED